MEPAAHAAVAVVDIVPLTLALCRDVDRLFRRDGGPNGAWGMYWRLQLSCLVRARLTAADYRFLLRKHLMTAKRAPGLLAYAQDVPVAYVEVGPRSDFPTFNRARASAVGDETDTERVWAIPSLYVAARFRGLGLANNLIDAACVFAHRRGARAIDAVPVDAPGAELGAVMAAGSAADCARQGFQEIARRSAGRPLMRRHFSRIIRKL